MTRARGLVKQVSPRVGLTGSEVAHKKSKQDESSCRESLALMRVSVVAVCVSMLRRGSDDG